MAQTVLHLPGGGETFWIMGNPLTIKVTAEETDGRVGCIELTVPPGAGPQLHQHGNEDEFFYVLEGTITFFGDFGTIDALTGSSLYVPRQELHAFVNNTDQTARLLTFFTPGGFENYFREIGTSDINGVTSLAEYRQRAQYAALRYDMSFAKSKDAEFATSRARFVAPDEGDKVYVLGNPIRFLVESEHTDGQCTIFESTALPGSFVPPHLHHHEDEIFYVLEGNLTIMLPEGQEAVIPAGGFLFSPKETPHAWYNRSESPVRILGMTTPGGFERFFRKVNGIADRRSIIAAATEYGNDFLLPI